MDLTDAAKELDENGKTVIKGVNANELLAILKEAGVNVEGLFIAGSFHQWMVVRKDLEIS